MESRELEEKLTPAARQAIEELLDDYRKEIVKVARNSAARVTGDVREISISDIANAVNRLGGRFPRLQRSPLDVVMRAYSMLGVLMAIVGLLVFAALKGVNLNLIRDDVLLSASLATAISGFIVALGSTFALRGGRLTKRLSPSLEREQVQLVGEFLLRWRDLELAVRNAAAQKLGESMATAPFSSLLNLITSEGVLTDQDAASLRRLLRLRNKLLHEGESMTQEEARAAVREAETLLRHLPAA